MLLGYNQDVRANRRLTQMNADNVKYLRLSAIIYGSSINTGAMALPKVLTLTRLFLYLHSILFLSSTQRQYKLIRTALPCKQR